MSITHKLYFVRHGESTANLTHITTPHDEDVLTEKGKVQAELLGKYLREQKVYFTKAYSSPYPRASDSAKLILAANNDGLRDVVKLNEDRRIREREFGEFMGKHSMDAYHAAEAAYQKGTPILKFEMPGAETAAEFEERLDSFLDDVTKDLLSSKIPETVLLVSHGLAMFRMLGKLRSRSNLEIATDDFKQACYRPMPNTGYHLLSFQLSPENVEDLRKIPLQFEAFHHKPHLVDMEKKQVGEQRSDFLKAAAAYKMNLDMIAECALQ